MKLCEEHGTPRCAGSATDKPTTILFRGQRVHRDVFVRFKREYEAAVAEKKEQFVHDGQPVLVAYAKYAIEYAESLLGRL